MQVFSEAIDRISFLYFLRNRAKEMNDTDDAAQVSA